MVINFFTWEDFMAKTVLLSALKWPRFPQSSDGGIVTVLSVHITMLSVKQHGCEARPSPVER